MGFMHNIMSGYLIEDKNKYKQNGAVWCNPQGLFKYYPTVNCGGQNKHLIS